MKPRRVLLTLEVLTDAPLPLLRDGGAYVALKLIDYRRDGRAWSACVEQAQANVVQPAPKRKRK